VSIRIGLIDTFQPSGVGQIGVSESQSTAAPTEGKGREYAEAVGIAQLRGDFLGVKREAKRQNEGNIARKFGNFRPG
jgi:hypothetical protein